MPYLNNWLLLIIEKDAFNQWLLNHSRDYNLTNF